MGGRIHRERLRANARALAKRFTPHKRVCPNCKEVLIDQGHFVPPGFGGPGIFICTKKE